MSSTPLHQRTDLEKAPGSVAPTYQTEQGSHLGGAPLNGRKFYSTLQGFAEHRLTFALLLYYRQHYPGRSTSLILPYSRDRAAHLSPQQHPLDSTQPAFPVYHRKFANPAPLGLSAFALTTFVLSLVNGEFLMFLECSERKRSRHFLRSR